MLYGSAPALRYGKLLFVFLRVSFVAYLLVAVVGLLYIGLFCVHSILTGLVGLLVGVHASWMGRVGLLYIGLFRVHLFSISRVGLLYIGFFRVRLKPLFLTRPIKEMYIHTTMTCIFTKETYVCTKEMYTNAKET